MNRKPILLLLFLLYSSALVAQQAWQPGEVLFLLNKENRVEDVQQEVSRQLPDGTTLKGIVPLGRNARYHKMEVQGTGFDVRNIEKLVARIPGVVATSLNYRIQYRAVPNDTDYGNQWSMDDINVEPVWDFTTGGTLANGKRIAVAISDEAIETTHPDLQNNIWPGSPHQGSGAFHGTAVASVVGAVGNNAQGIAGVNWDVDIVSSAAAFDLSDVIDVFEDALTLRQQFNNSNGVNGAMVVSVTASWGTPGILACDGFSYPLFHDMATAGILVITSGPNEPTDLDVAPEYPSSCALAEHLVVGSIGPLGQTPYAFGDNSVHLLAPGLDVPVADEFNNYQFADGNSFAIPHVAGAIALLYSVPCPGFAALVMDDPQAARDLVKNAILNNTAPVPGGNALTITGGKLNVFAAYQALMAQCPSCDTVTVNLTTAAGAAAVFTLENGSGDLVAQGTGDSIAFCAQEGCFNAVVLDGASQPLTGTFTVELFGTTLSSGTIENGALNFVIGTVITGCTDPGANNFNPLANCDDGSCCQANAVTLTLFAQDQVANGTALLLVEAAGDTLYSGPVTIAYDAQADASFGKVTLCAPPGCLSVMAQQNDVILFEAGLAEIPGGPYTEYYFPIGEATTVPVGVSTVEQCDGIDNNCNGLVDEDFQWFPDADNDGVGANVPGTISCTPIEGFVAVDGDCDDANAAIFPGAADPCEGGDGIDNDCNGLVDDQDAPIWFVDADGDGWGADIGLIQVCTAPPDYVSQGGDCDDTNVNVFPGSAELCDGLDNDCDGLNDEDYLWYPDADGDGVGTNDVEAITSCTQPPGMVANNADCNDAAATVYPGAPELCDLVDNDCDGITDEDFFWFVDVDNDGFGDPATVQYSCTPIPGSMNIGGDCDDADANITLPGSACDDGNPGTIDDVILASCTCLGFVQGACDDGEIEDCNGNCAPVEWVGDNTCDDGSFEWNGNFIDFNCIQFANDGGDCANSGGIEVCDGQDNDNDGLIDEDFFWYTDADGDGFGDPASLQYSCTPLPGLINTAGDCDDGNIAIHPGAAEVCDGLDNNCDGFIDGTSVNFQSGCTDPMACNYDPNAVCPDASCVQGSIADGNETFATDFTATDVNGNTVNLFALLAQGKTVILDFFTTWCLPSNQMNSAGFLQDWYAHMGPDSLDHIRIVSIEIEDTASVTGSLAPFLADATWPFIADGGNAIMQQYAALDLYNGFVPTIVMICPDRSAQRIYGLPDQLPYANNFTYNPTAALELINEKCGCRGTPCLTNIGCMDVNACNYDPAATCPGPCTQAHDWFADVDGDGYGGASLGISCAQPANSTGVGGDCDDNNPDGQVGFDLYVLSETENDFGSAHYVITQGSNVIEGDIQLPEETQGIGMLPFCIGTGCFNVQITPNDVPLWEESYITPPNVPEETTPFSTIDGFFGSLSGPAQEVCDGIDNDCDGQVDEGLPQQFADNDGDGFGDPNVPVVCGTSGAVTNQLDCDDSDPAANPSVPEVCNGIDDDCDGEVDESCVLVSARVFLEGPYDSGSGLMADGMRALGLVPTTEPYTGIGYVHVGGGGETTTPAVLAVPGNNAIVDWVLMELRGTLAGNVISASRSALVQRDGDVVDMDGVSPVSFTIAPGSYHVAVRHRNHLGAMTSDMLALSTSAITVDFTSASTITYGTDARKASAGVIPVLQLWAGDVTFDHIVKYTGQTNDRDPILLTIGGLVPTNTTIGYHVSDVNLDGTVKYTGTLNDRDPILLTIGGVVPTNVRMEQLP